MTPRLSVAVRSGSLTGTLCWHVEASSFALHLWPDDAVPISISDPATPGSRWVAATTLGHSPCAARPPNGVVVGGRPGEFPTVDSILNHLVVLGAPQDAESIQNATTLRDRVTAIFGEVELVGIGDRGPGRLYLVRPDLRTMSLSASLGSPHYRFRWGCTGVATMDTARALIAAALSRRWGSDEEMCANALVYNFLARADPLFSISANSLCDWFLLDGELSTTLGTSELRRMATYER